MAEGNGRKAAELIDSHLAKWVTHAVLPTIIVVLLGIIGFNFKSLSDDVKAVHATVINIDKRLVAVETRQTFPPAFHAGGE